ncbi:hypothetical protein [Halomicrobium urmianum]|uniref:hypothetical protein n=1 Tax=Halomicrobium urmianum TaxID=1586233 RepID=UPI001CD94A39|nr:hypothetical protein [Halomicrobium urmianum]
MAGPTLLEFVVGIVALVLGVLWVAYPMKMIRLQAKISYIGDPDPGGPRTDRQRRIGRIGGVVLAASGAALAAGLF